MPTREQQGAGGQKPRKRTIRDRNPDLNVRLPDFSNPPPLTAPPGFLSQRASLIHPQLATQFPDLALSFLRSGISNLDLPHVTLGVWHAAVSGKLPAVTQQSFTTAPGYGAPGRGEIPDIVAPRQPNVPTETQAKIVNLPPPLRPLGQWLAEQQSLNPAFGLRRTAVLSKEQDPDQLSNLILYTKKSGDQTVVVLRSSVQEMLALGTGTPGGEITGRRQGEIIRTPAKAANTSDPDFQRAVKAIAVIKALYPDASIEFQSGGAVGTALTGITQFENLAAPVFAKALSAFPHYDESGAGVLDPNKDVGEAMRNLKRVPQPGLGELWDMSSATSNLAFGKTQALVAGLKPTDPGYDAFVNATNFIDDWYVNPLVVGGKVGGALKAARTVPTEIGEAKGLIGRTIYGTKAKSAEDLVTATRRGQSLQASVFDTIMRHGQEGAADALVRTHGFTTNQAKIVAEARNPTEVGQFLVDHFKGMSKTDIDALMGRRLTLEGQVANIEKNRAAPEQGVTDFHGDALASAKAEIAQIDAKMRFSPDNLAFDPLRVLPKMKSSSRLMQAGAETFGDSRMGRWFEAHILNPSDITLVPGTRINLTKMFTPIATTKPLRNHFAPNAVRGDAQLLRDNLEAMMVDYGVKPADRNIVLTKLANADGQQAVTDVLFHDVVDAIENSPLHPNFRQGAIQYFKDTFLYKRWGVVDKVEKGLGGVDVPMERSVFTHTTYAADGTPIVVSQPFLRVHLADEFYLPPHQGILDATSAFRRLLRKLGPNPKGSTALDAYHVLSAGLDRFTRGWKHAILLARAPAVFIRTFGEESVRAAVADVASPVHKPFTWIRNMYDLNLREADLNAIRDPGARQLAAEALNREKDLPLWALLAKNQARRDFNRAARDDLSTAVGMIHGQLAKQVRMSDQHGKPLNLRAQGEEGDLAWEALRKWHYTLRNDELGKKLLSTSSTDELIQWAKTPEGEAYIRDMGSLPKEYDVPESVAASDAAAQRLAEMDQRIAEAEGRLVAPGAELGATDLERHLNEPHGAHLIYLKAEREKLAAQVTAGAEIAGVSEARLRAYFDGLRGFTDHITGGDATIKRGILDGGIQTAETGAIDEAIAHVREAQQKFREHETFLQGGETKEADQAFHEGRRLMDSAREALGGATGKSDRELTRMLNNPDTIESLRGRQWVDITEEQYAKVLQQWQIDGRWEKPPVWVSGDVNDAPMAASRSQRRGFINWMYSAFLSGPEGFMARKPFMREFTKQRYDELTRLGWKHDAAMANATVWGTEQTRQLLYDLSERTSAQTWARNLAPFLPAYQEILTTWAWKLPNRMYPILGHAYLASRANQVVGLLKDLGVDPAKAVAFGPMGYVLNHMIGGPDWVGTFKPKDLNLVAGSIFPGLGPAPSIVLSALAKKYHGAFEAVAGMVMPYGLDVQLGPANVNRAYEAFFHKPPPWEVASGSKQADDYAMAKDDSIRHAYVSLAEEGIHPPSPSLASTDPLRFRNEQRDFVTQLKDRADHNLSIWYGVRAAFGTFFPAPLTVTDKYKADIQNFYDEIGNMSQSSPEAQAAWQRWLSDHPYGDFYRTPKTVRTAAQKPPGWDAEHQDSYVKFRAEIDQKYRHVLTEDEFVSLGLGFASRNLLNAQLDQQLKAIGGGTGPGLLTDWWKAAGAFADYNEKFTQYEKLNTTFKHLYDDMGQNAHPGSFLGHSLYLDHLSQFVQIGRQLQHFDSGTLIPQADLRKVLGEAGVALAKANYYSGGQLDGVQWWFKNVADPYYTKLEPLYKQAQKWKDLESPTRPDAYVQHSLAMERVREFKTRQEQQAGPDGLKYPTPEMYQWGNLPEQSSNPADPSQESLRTDWLTLRPEWLTPFQMKKVGLGGSEKQNRFAQVISDYDARLDTYISAHKVYPSSNEYDRLQATRQTDLTNAAAGLGPSAVKLWQWANSTAASRLVKSGWAKDDNAFSNSVYLSDAIRARIEGAGYSYKGSSELALTYKRQFYTFLDSQYRKDSVFQADLNLLMHTMGRDLTKPAPRYAVYAALYFDDFTGL